MSRTASARRVARAAALALVTSVALTLVMSTAAYAATITPVTGDTAGATTLATAMVADPTTLTGASFVAVPPAGTPNGTSDALSSFPTSGTTFGILTTGNVNFADDPNSAGNTTAVDGGGSVRGDTDLDVTVLRLDLAVPTNANCLRLDFAFYSEEYPEWVGSAFNDAFIAELDASTWTTSGSTISAPDNFAFDPTGGVISINSTGSTSMNPANAAGTTYDGATTLLEAATPITPGPHSLFLSVFDQGDQEFDSAAFVDNIRLVTVADPATQCEPGARAKTLTLSPPTATNVVGTSHTVTATAALDGLPVPGATVNFTVTGANTGSGSCLTDATGSCTFTYSGASVGLDAITATTVIDGETATATANKEWTPPPDADLSVSKADDPDPVASGQNLTYTVTVANDGPADATNVTLTDTLPAGATFVSATPAQGTCAESGGTVTCNLGAVANGSSVLVEIEVTAPTPVGTLTNTASVSGDQPDPDPADNVDTETTAVVPVGIAIDIKPGSFPNSINLGNNGVIPVAILSTPGFDATTVDPTAVCFGDAESPAERDCTEAHGQGHVEDVDGDGDLDLVLHFETGETGIDPTDTRACLSGVTTTGVVVEGCDSVRIVRPRP